MNSANKGYCGKILHVDLSKGEVSHQELDEAFYKKYLSGIGLASKVLWDSIKAGTDPMGPGNILGFTTGLLTDTGTLFTGRFTVVGKSPVYNGWGEANCGGYFAPYLKRCGFDAVFFRGRSPKPVYFYLDENSTRIEDASHIWGLDTYETESRLKEQYGKRVQVAAIGPAGEKLSFIAGICTDGGRIAARSGLGAVMGSKNLKAFIVAGKIRPGVFNKKEIANLSKAFLKKINRLKFLERFMGDRLIAIWGRLQRPGWIYPRLSADLWRIILGKFGTSCLTVMSAECGDSPIKNWGGSGYRDFPLSKSQKIGAESISRYHKKKYGCFSCPIRCGAVVEISNGTYPIKRMLQPEYETICAFGSLLLNNDINSIFKLNDLVNRGGIDSISCGSTLAFAIECFENNILDLNDTGGLDLRWGNGEAIIKMTEMIIHREGLGDILADGVKSAAERIGKGAEAYAVHCGGVEAPMHDPKFDPGFILSYFCEPTPGRHTIASYQFLDLQSIEKKFTRAKKRPVMVTRKGRFTYEGNAENISVNSLYKTLIDCAGACLFGTQIGGDIPLCEWMNAATGWNLSNDEYLHIAERVHLLKHAFNVREGINPIRDFRPHRRVYGKLPFLKGPARGVTLDIDLLAEEYYRAMHWDKDTGKPDLLHLQNMGLSEISEVLYPDKSFST